MGFPFLIRKGRFLPILFASTRAKPLDAACNPLGPPRRGNSGWDSPFSSRPIRNAGVSLSREAEALGCRGQSSQTKSRAADDGTERSRGNGQRESRLGFLFFFRKKPLSSNFIRSGKGEAFGCRVQSTRPAAQRNFRLGFPVFFPSYPQRRHVAFEGAEALGYRGQSSQTKSRAADGSTGRSRGNGQRESRLGFPSFLFEKAAFFQFYPQRQGRSPWMPRAVHPARRAEEIPVGIPRFLLILCETVACRFRGGL